MGKALVSTDVKNGSGDGIGGEARDMDNNAQPPLLAAQQAAISEARARYERGDLTFEGFRRALDALVLARDADECRVILDALPTVPLAPFQALERSPAPVADEYPHRRIVAVMGQTKKGRQPWRLAPSTEAVAFMGEIQLDLRRAELPARARLQVTAVMSTAVILVPRNVRVSVHTTMLLSGAQTLGEAISGVIGSSHEQHVPALGEPAVAELEIEISALMSTVKVVLVDESTITVGELVREALRAIVSGVRSGIQQSRERRALPGAYGE